MYKFILVSLIVLACLTFLMPSDVRAELKGAVGIWLFDEGTGDVAKDSSGNKNDGKLKGGKWVTGKFGKALEFNGTNELVEVTDAASLDLETQVTMVNWFWWEGTGDGWQTFFSKGPIEAPAENWALFINSGGRHLHFCLNPNNGRVCFNSPVNAFDIKKWHHAAATWDGKTQIVYLDGKEVAKQPLAGKLVVNNKYLGLGFRENSPHWWKGMLDDMAVFNRALPAEEIKAIMEKGIRASLAVDSKNKLATTWGMLKTTP